MVKVNMNEAMDYWDMWLTDRDERAADELMRIYTPLVQYHVQRIKVGLPRGVDENDLLSHGYMGLYDALRKFDFNRDLKFDTYASFRVKGAIIDGLRKEDWIPRSMREKNKKVEAVMERLEQTYMRSVTMEEVAVEVGMSTSEVASVITHGMTSHMLSIDDEINESEPSKDKYLYMLEDKQLPLPDERVLNREATKQLAEQIKRLTEKEQLVISLFYFEELTLTEIGKVLELSTSRISQIHSRALVKLKQILNDEDDAYYL